MTFMTTNGSNDNNNCYRNIWIMFLKHLLLWSNYSPQRQRSGIYQHIFK